MPRGPHRPCPVPGCAVIGPCPVHKTQRAKETARVQLARAPWRAFYLSSEWDRARKAQLAREPMCAHCGKPASDADHIIPISEGGARTDRRNLQSLCRPCHGRKTRQDRLRRRDSEREMP